MADDSPPTFRPQSPDQALQYLGLASLPEKNDIVKQEMARAAALRGTPTQYPGVGAAGGIMAGLGSGLRELVSGIHQNSAMKQAADLAAQKQGAINAGAGFPTPPPGSPSMAGSASDMRPPPSFDVGMPQTGAPAIQDISPDLTPGQVGPTAGPPPFKGAPMGDPYAAMLGAQGKLPPFGL